MISPKLARPRILTHLPLHKMAAISQMTFSNACVIDGILSSVVVCSHGFIFISKHSYADLFLNRNYSGYGLNQWETTLRRNVFSLLIRWAHTQNDSCLKSKYKFVTLHWNGVICDNLFGQKTMISKTYVIWISILSRPSYPYNGIPVHAVDIKLADDLVTQSTVVLVSMFKGLISEFKGGRYNEYLLTLQGI